MAADIHRSTILNRKDAKIKMHKILLNSFEGVSVSSSSLPLGEGDKSGCSLCENASRVAPKEKAKVIAECSSIERILWRPMMCRYIIFVEDRFVCKDMIR